MRRFYTLALVIFLLCGACACAIEYVTIERDGQRKELSGRVQIEAQDGGLLLLGRDGVLWALQPEEITSRSKDDTPFEQLDREAMKKQLLAELPDGFEIHETAHYIVTFNTSRAYAQWVGSLFERLYRGFYNYWDKKGVSLHAPELPLVVCLFRDASSYAQFSRAEVGEAAESIVGYYSLQSNQVITYDLTGRGDLRTGKRPNSLALINKVLAGPRALPTVATIIHEATHQLAYNSGLQRRYADNPLWVSEGLAIYFETPDLKNARGWRGIGTVHPTRLKTLRAALPQYTYAQFLQMLTNDKVLQDPKTAVGGYAQAWGWMHFLANRYPRQLASYLVEMARFEPLTVHDGEERVALFRKHFGNDLEKIYGQFLKHITTLRP